jgi:hypothetical protein
MQAAYHAETVVSGADPGSAVGHLSHSRLLPRRGLLTDQGRRQRSKVKPAPARYATTEVTTTPVVEVERIYVYTHAHQASDAIAFPGHALHLGQRSSTQDTAATTAWRAPACPLPGS